MKKFLCALALAFALAPAAQAATEPHDLNADQRAQLTTIKGSLDAIASLEERKAFEGDSANKCRQVLLSDAAKVAGRDNFTVDEFNSYLAECNKTVGFGIFINTLIVIAGIIGLLAFLGLIGFYFWPILINIPVFAYEIGAYVLTAVLLLGAMYWQPFDIWFLRIQPIWFVVPGIFAFPCCVMLTRGLHWGKIKQARSMKEVAVHATDEEVFFGPGMVRFPVILFGLCTLVWGGLAIAYHDQLPYAGIPYFMGFLAVMALQSFLGFSVITMPGCVCMGWEKDDQVPRSVTGSFILLAFYVSAKLASQTLPPFVELFTTGAVFMGSFVFFLGMLVMSSKWYSWRERHHRDEKTGNVTMTTSGFQQYCFMQFLTVVSGLSALYVGMSFGIPILTGIGGTFFALFALEKYYEIPWKGVGWAWSLLGLAAGIYFFVGFAGQHPEYFVWGVK